MKFFHGSIRKKLVVLVLLATMPVFLVLLGTELVNRQYAINAAKKDTASYLNGFAEVQRRITGSTRTLLGTVVSMPAIRNAHVERSRVILSALLEANPIYSNVILVDLKGNVVAAGKNHDRARQFNFADRKQFREAIASRGFASGEFVVGKSSNKAIFPFGMAVVDEEDTPRGVILIGVSLSHYGSLFERGDYPKNTFMGLCDHNGMRLFRYPESEKIDIGKPIRSKVFQAARTKGGPGSIIARASDGMERIIVFEPLCFGDKKHTPYMYMFIGFDHEQIQGRAHAILTRLATTSVLSLTLALFIAWFIGGHSIARRVEKLTLMTKKFSQGEKNVTSSVDYSDDEVGNLARSFDNMVIMLQQHEDERNTAIEQLRSSEERYREIVEGTQNLVTEVDTSGRLIFTNEASRKVFGLPPQKCIGKLFFDFVHPGDMQKTKKFFAKWLETGASNATFENRQVSHSGQVRDMLWSIKIHHDDEGNIVSIKSIARDISDRKKAENEKIEAQKIISENEKLALVGQIAGKIAHDFNNILGIIMGNTELALLDCQEPQTTKTLELIYEQTMRGKNLTKNLVAFAKDQVPKHEFLRISEKIDLVLNLMRKDLEKIEIRKEESPDVPELLADPGMLEHVFVNIIQNSIHALSRVEYPVITVRTYTRDNRIWFEIEDNGCGIPKENLINIYEPSFTLKGRKDVTGSYKIGIKGTGYGMSNVKKYVEQHKGTISIKSEYGSGTNITISLPVINKKLTIEEKKEIRLGKTHLAKYILIVEDEKDIADVQYRMLSQAPCHHKVDIANNGQVANDLFRKNKYDLISLDYILPGDINGMDIYNYIRSSDKTIPILFISGNIEFLESIKDLMKKDPYVDHLSKPCQNQDYINGVNKLLEKALAAQE